MGDRDDGEEYDDEEAQPPLPHQQGAQRNEDADSVDLEFGNEYSEETLNMLRNVDRPAYLEETSSLDPVEDLSEYVEHNLSLPPATYDTLQELGKEQIAELEELGQLQLAPDEQDAIRYRQRLAQGTSHQDMTWLKLRAYHRAMDKLAAADQQERQQLEAQRLREYEVPTDRVPPELLHLTPAQLAARRRLAAAVAHKAQQRRDIVQRILSRPEPSEESEWQGPDTLLLTNHPVGTAHSHDGQQQRPWQLPYAAQEAVRLALAQHQGGLSAHVHLAEPLAGPADGQPAVAPTKEAEEEGAAAAAATQAREWAVWPLRTVYTKTYLHQQELQQRVRMQQRQRTTAFWLSFLAVAGAYAVRMVRRGLFKKKKPGTKAGTKPQDGKQPKQSEALATSSAAPALVA